MSDPTLTPTITQQDVEVLLGELKELRERIKAARTAIAPLETHLKQAYDEFQNFVGAARRQSMRLDAEINNLRDRIDSLNSDPEDFSEFDSPPKELTEEQSNPLESEGDPEVIEKDKLLEYLHWVLDPMDENEADLFANLQTLCQDPTVSLAEVLEQSPWESVWQAKPRQETPSERYHRLQRWKTSLTEQLERLDRMEERLRKDPRYGLWQQQRKGVELWQQFLQQALEQQEDRNCELQTELEALQQEWEQLRST